MSSVHLQTGGLDKAYNPYVKDEAYWYHKAKKYHYKNRKIIQAKMNAGEYVADEYKVYLQPFDTVTSYTQ